MDDEFSEKVEAANILACYVAQKRYLLTSICVRKIIESIKDGKEAGPEGPEQCSICWKMEKLFKKSWNVGSKIPNRNVSPECLQKLHCDETTESKVDEIWKSFKETWFSDQPMKSDKDQNKKSEVCVTEQIRKPCDWKILYTSIAETLLPYSTEDVETEASVNQTDSLTSFLVRINSTKATNWKVVDEVKNIVSFEVCSPCLEQVSYNLHNPHAMPSSDLVNHLTAMLYVCANELSDSSSDENDVGQHCKVVAESPVAMEAKTTVIVTNDDLTIRKKSFLSNCAVGPPVTIPVGNFPKTAQLCSSKFITSKINGTEKVKSLQKNFNQTKKNFIIKIDPKHLSGNIKIPNTQAKMLCIVPGDDNLHQLKISTVKKRSRIDKKNPKIISSSQFNWVKIEPDSMAGDNKPTPKASSCDEVIDILVDSNESPSPTSGKKPPKPRTPRKSNEKSMDGIVAEYLNHMKKDGSNLKFSNTSASESRRKAGAPKMTPIPYEAHYLCIDETVSRKGWKAYWYKRCRCAKSLKVVKRNKNGRFEKVYDESTVKKETVKNKDVFDVSNQHDSKRKQVWETEGSKIVAKCKQHIDSTITKGLLDPYQNEDQIDQKDSKNHCEKGKNLSPELVERKQKVEKLLSKSLNQFSERLAVDQYVSGSVRSFAFSQFTDSECKQTTMIDIVTSQFEEFPVIQERIKEKTKNSKLFLSSDEPVKSPIVSNKPAELELLWSFGMTQTMFEERKTIKPQQKTVQKTNWAQIRKPLAVKNKIKKHLPFFSKRKLISIKPLSLKPNFHKTSLAFDMNDYSVDKIPQLGKSSVVKSLLHQWGEVVPPYGAVEITQEQIDRAMSVVRNHSEVFTFSSKSIMNKKGKNTVLLISRKYIDSTTSDNFLEKESAEEKCEEKYGKENVGKEKIVLKLKKTPSKERVKKETYTSMIPEFDAERQDVFAKASNDKSVKPLFQKIDGNASKENSAQVSAELAEDDDDKQNGLIHPEASEQLPVTNLEMENQKVNIDCIEHTSCDVAKIQDKDYSKSSKQEVNVTKSPNARLDIPKTDGQQSIEMHDIGMSGDIDQDQTYHFNSNEIGCVIKNENFSTKSNCPKTVNKYNETEMSLDEVSQMICSSDEWETPPTSPRDHQIKIEFPSFDAENLVMNTEWQKSTCEMLKLVTKDSLDILEKILFSPQLRNISPHQFVKILQKSTLNNEAFCNNDLKSQSVTPVTSPVKLTHLTPESIMESPEFIRGANPQNENQIVNLQFSSDEDFQGSPASPNHDCADSEASKPCNDTCNGKVDTSQNLISNSDKADSNTNLISTSKSCAKPHKLSKQSALNGLYWNTPTTELEGSRNLRDRDKRQMTPTTTVSSRLNDTTSSSDSDKTIYEPGNKRKALGLVKYNGPSDNELLQVVKSIWEEKAPTEKPLSLFKSLFERHLDMQQIRRWMYRSTESHPRPFILPSFKPIRTNIKSRKSSCSRSRRSNSVFSNASSNASDGSKKCKLTKTHPKNSRSEPKAPDYDDLRRRLFMQRNPDYRGSIIDPLEVSSECSTLIRINEDATTGESPILPTHLTRDGPSSPKRRRRNLPRCQTPPSKHGDDAVVTSFDLEFASSCDDVKRKRHLTSSCNSANDVTPMESTSSNGDENLSRMTSRSVTSRALRPSRAAKSAGGETPKPIASPKTVGSRGSQVRRFVNRHSSMGSFIKRVIESGVYD